MIFEKNHLFFVCSQFWSVDWTRMDSSWSSISYTLYTICIWQKFTWIWITNIHLVSWLYLASMSIHFSRNFIIFRLNISKLLQQFACSFEFNDTLLIELFEHAYSSKFGKATIERQFLLYSNFAFLLQARLFLIMKKRRRNTTGSNKQYHFGLILIDLRFFIHSWIHFMNRIQLSCGRVLPHRVLYVDFLRRLVLNVGL